MNKASVFNEMVNKRPQNMDGILETPTKPTFPRVIAVTSGKGGVGKTSVVGNLAIAFRRLGKRVLILDGDLGLANIDLIFGLNPKHNIRHVMSGEKDLAEVIIEGPEDIHIIPAGSGVHDLAHLTNGQKLNLLNEFDTLNEDFDIFLIDTGAGISSNIIYFNIAAQERIVVATCEPSSIRSACALMKVIFTEHGTKRFKLLANMVKDAQEARLVLYLGFIPKDEHCEKAAKEQRPVLQRFPHCKSSKGFCELAERLLTSSAEGPSDGNIKFFWRKLMSCH